MEISDEQLGIMKANFPFLEYKYSMDFVVFKLINHQHDHHVVWIRGSIDGVHLAKMALMVIDYSLFRVMASIRLVQIETFDLQPLSGITTN